MPKITVAYRPTPESLAVAASAAMRPVSWGVLALVAAMTAQNACREAQGLVDYHWLSYALAGAKAKAFADQR